jgi:hypothetical protein
MRSLLLVESFDLHPSNQYILVRVIPNCFRLTKMCLCQVHDVVVNKLNTKETLPLFLVVQIADKMGLQKKEIDYVFVVVRVVSK